MCLSLHRSGMIVAISPLLMRSLLGIQGTLIPNERELDETVPTLHRTLEEDRRRILTRVSQLIVGSLKSICPVSWDCASRGKAGWKADLQAGLPARPISNRPPVGNLLHSR